MTIVTDQHESASVIRLSGRFDAHVTAAFSAEFDSIATEDGRVVVDLSAVGFVDTSGLAILVQAMKQCRERKGDLRLAGPQDPVRIILELTRLDRAIQVYPNVEDALASFTSKNVSLDRSSILGSNSPAS